MLALSLSLSLSLSMSLTLSTSLSTLTPLSVMLLIVSTSITMYTVDASCIYVNNSTIDLSSTLLLAAVKPVAPVNVVNCAAIIASLVDHTDNTNSENICLASSSESSSATDSSLFASLNMQIATSLESEKCQSTFALALCITQTSCTQSFLSSFLCPLILSCSVHDQSIFSVFFPAYSCYNDTQPSSSSSSSFSSSTALAMNVSVSHCEPLHSTSVCAPILGGTSYHYYNNGTIQQQQLEAIASSSFSLALSFLSAACTPFFESFLCQSIFVKCNTFTVPLVNININNSSNRSTSNVTLSVPVQSRICREQCLQMLAVCPIAASSINCYDSDIYSIYCSPSYPASSASPSSLTVSSSFPPSSSSSLFLLPPLFNTVDASIQSQLIEAGAVKLDPSSLTPSNNATTLSSIVSRFGVPVPCNNQTNYASSSTLAPPLCLPLPSTSVCSTVLSYSVSLPPASAFSCQTSIELTIETRPWAAMTKQCRESMAMYQCATAYKPCSSSSSLPPASLCESVLSSCTSLSDYLLIELVLGHGAPMQCDTASANSQYVFPQPVVPQYPICEAYTGRICQGVINYPVYSSPANSQSSTETALQPLVSLFATAPVGNSYLSNIAALLCFSSFPRCLTNVVSVSTTNMTMPRNAGSGSGSDSDSGSGATVNVQLPVPVPQFASKEQCRAVQQMYDNKTNAFLNCDQKVNVLGCHGSVVEQLPLFISVNYSLPSFPNYNTPMIITPNVYSLQDVSVSVICPSPLVVPDDPTLVARGGGLNGGSCALPCLSFVFSPSTWSALFAFNRIVFPITLLFLIVLFVSWEFDASMSRTPPHFCAFSGIGTMIVNVSSAYGPQDYSGVCKNNVELRTDTACIVTGHFYSFFFTATMLWVAMMSVDLMLIVLFDSGLWSSRRKRQAAIVMHVVVWTTTAITNVASAVDGAVGANQGYFICFRTSTNGYSWWLLQILRDVCASLIVIAVLSSLISLVSRTSSLSSGSHRWKRILRELNRFRRIFMFFGLFVVCYVISDYTIYVSYFGQENFANSLGAWLRCQLSSYPNPCPSSAPVLLSDDLFLTSMYVASCLWSLAFIFIYMKLAYLCSPLIWCLRRMHCSEFARLVSSMTMSTTNTIDDTRSRSRSTRTVGGGGGGGGGMTKSMVGNGPKFMPMPSTPSMGATRAGVELMTSSPLARDRNISGTVNFHVHMPVRRSSIAGNSTAPAPLTLTRDRPLSLLPFNNQSAAVEPVLVPEFQS